MSRELMIDLETLGTTADCVVLSIGACFFDTETKEVGPTFLLNPNVEQQTTIGRKVNANTLKWWLEQDEKAKKVFSEPSFAIEDTLNLLSSWITTNDPKSEVRVWGNGSTFDISILENLYAQMKAPVPWKYSNVMDLRTFRRFVADNAKVSRIEGTHHNALDDAKNQAQFVIDHVNKGVTNEVV